MVLDNQTAKIQVGKEVPVATSQQQGTSQTDRIINPSTHQPDPVP